MSRRVMMHSLASVVMAMGGSMDFSGTLKNKRVKHWKEDQPENERQDKLEKAKQKRARKALKKQNEQR